MTFPSQGQIDVIATQILLDAKQALLSLKAWNNSITDAAAKTKFLKEIIAATAKQMGGDFKAAAAAVQKFAKALNINPQLVQKIGKDLQLLDRIAKTSLKGVGQSSVDASARIRLLSEAITMMAAKAKISVTQVASSLKTLNAAAGTRFGKLGFSSVDIDKAADSARRLNGELPKFAKGAKEAESAFGRVFTAINAMRIALGAVVSMLLFQFIQAVTQTVRDSIKEFTELEDSLWRIRVAEKALSEQGIEISTKGLKEGIKEITDLLPIFSEEDITALVGKIAIQTKELGYNEQQVLELAKAYAILNVVSTETEDLTQTAQKGLTALLSGTTKGVSGLGLTLNDTTIKLRAVEEGFIKTTDSVKDLTKEQKDYVKWLITTETAADSLQLANEYLETNSAKIKESNAAWNDFKAAAGGFIATIIPAFSPVLEFLTDAVNGFKAISILLEISRVSIAHIVTSLFAGKNAIEGIRNAILAFKDIPKIFDAIAEDAVPKMFAQIPENAPEWFKDLFGEYLQDVETATDLTAKWKDELEDEDALKALEDLEDKIQDILLDARQAQEDLDIRLEQKREDLDLEYLRKEADAATDHAQKLEDINQDALDKIEDAKRKAREAEGKEEQKLLQRLKELRERFLLDLEDALHARDARAVLRLIKEYKLEKQNILDRAALEKQQRKESLAEDLKNIEIDRQRRIEDAKIEYQRKLADLAVAKQREQEALQVWYKREQEDIQRNIEQKLERLLAGYIQEEKLHVEHQEEIQKILAKYFGEDMQLMGSLTEFMAQQFAAVVALAQATQQALMFSTGLKGGGFGGGGFTQPFVGSTGGGSTTSPRKPRTAYAEGGSYLATRPTTALFGERGAELATFTPIGRSGRDVGKLFGDVGGGGVNGQIMVAVDLSPDLEGRIVNKSMDGVAEIITKVNRTKL